MSSSVSESLNQRVNSILNDSSTKYAYSFGHALRFKPNSIKDNFYHFYKLPEIRSNRGTTLGYGKKCNYSQIVGCGSNKLYAAPNYFDPKQHNAPVYSFGVSRPNKLRKDVSPGPKYDVTNKFGENVPGFVFGTSGMKKSRMRRSSSLPGPGSYFNEEHHKIGPNYNSKLINLGNVVIGKEKRFLTKEKDQTPGPGSYNIPGLEKEMQIELKKWIRVLGLDNIIFFLFLKDFLIRIKNNLKKFFMSLLFFVYLFI